MTFGRVLDKALNSPELLDALEQSGRVLNREQLRTRALQARDEIAGAAAVEYRAFVGARAAAAARSEQEGAGGAGTSDSGGLLPVLAVLGPSLAAVSAAVFLLTGYGLRAFGGRPYISDGLITAGLIAAAVTAGGLIGDFVYVLVAAARNRTGGQGDALDRSDSEVTRVRDEWELALLERGAMPFLLACLEEAGDAHQGGNPAL